MSDGGRPLLAYYGDDFTGSTDVLEALARAGLRTALFLEPPRPEQLIGRFEGLQAIGVAGTSRSMSPDRMDATLPTIFRSLGRLGPAFVHYKTCSTFDSSPEVGSIGRAVDLGRRTLDSPVVPLVVGAPILRRYCVFGNLFATVGEETFRLDRHPTMRRHPVTPMAEADLRLHLSRQTDATIALMDILHLAGPPREVDRRLAAIIDDGAEVVLFDVLDESHLAEVGRLIWSRRGDRPQFAAGSSGFEYALVAHWRAAGMLPDPPPIPPAGPVDRLAVVSGSCSPTTRDQIDWARHHGFAEIKMNVGFLIDPGRAEAERISVVHRAADVLADARGVIIASASGPDDPRIAATLERTREFGLSPASARDRIGLQLGLILRDLIETTGLRRVVVAGGDTSGHAARQLGIDALEFVMSIAPGSPLCRASSDRNAVDGLEIVLKGGQVGQADFFGEVMRGEP